MTTTLLRRMATGVALATMAGLVAVPALSRDLGPCDRPDSDHALHPHREVRRRARRLDERHRRAARPWGGRPAGARRDARGQAAGHEEFVPVAEAATREHGGLRVTVTPSTSTRYRWHYAGDELTRPSVSGIARVGVRTPDHPADPPQHDARHPAVAPRRAHRAPRPSSTAGWPPTAWPCATAGSCCVSRTPDAEAWAFEDVAQTGPDGRVAFAVAPGGPTAYRLAFLGTPLLQPVRSAVVRVARPADGDHRRDADGRRPGRYHDRLRHRQHGSRPGRRRPGRSCSPGGSARASGLEVVGTGTTASDGTVAIAATPLRSQFYRLRVLRTEGVPRAISERVRVDVRAATSLSIRGRTVADAYVVSGVLRGGGSTLANREVALLAQTPGTTEWVQVDTALTGPHGMARFDAAAGAGHGVPAVVRRRPAAGALCQRRRLPVTANQPRTRTEDTILTSQASYDDLGRPGPTGSGRGPSVSAEPDLDRALDLARAGDETGFATLWRALHPPLLRYLAVRGNAHPEDIAGETWLQVVRDLDGFRGDAQAFRGWLFAAGPAPGDRRRPGHRGPPVGAGRGPGRGRGSTRPNPARSSTLSSGTRRLARSIWSARSRRPRRRW